MIYMHFESPPTPHFISAGEKHYTDGETDIKKRSSIGVFDMLFVVSGPSLSYGRKSTLYNRRKSTPYFVPGQNSSRI